MYRFLVTIIISFLFVTFSYGQEENGYSQKVKNKTYHYDKAGNCMGFDRYDPKRKATIHYDCRKKEVGYVKVDSKTRRTINYDTNDNIVSYSKVKSQKTYRYDKDDNCFLITNETDILSRII